MLYKITYDLVAIPLTDYLTPNRRQSKFIHPLAYRQISTTTNYCKYSFFPRTAVHWNALPISIVMLPTVCDLVAIPLTDYLTPNRRQSKFIHPLAYRQISTTTNYCKYSFFPRTAVHWNALPISIVMLPTVSQFSHAVCQVVHVSP